MKRGKTSRFFCVLFFLFGKTNRLTRRGTSGNALPPAC
nr:MAG TPA: hypothetical protein [Caudoviricetes sp.]